MAEEVSYRAGYSTVAVRGGSGVPSALWLYDAEVQRIVSHIHRHRSRRIIVGFFCLVVLLTVSFFVTHNTLLTDIGDVLKIDTRTGEYLERCKK